MYFAILTVFLRFAALINADDDKAVNLSDLNSLSDISDLGGLSDISDENGKPNWDSYKLKHQKAYEDDSEDEFRRSIFTANVKRVQDHNERYKKGEVTYTLAMNKYGDLSSAEFDRMMNGYIMVSSVQDSNSIEFLPPLNAPVPTAVDWRKQGLVSSIKNQGSCGSCWAFSAVAALEGQWFQKTKQLLDLSEQNIVDCSKEGVNRGCNGGWMTGAFDYIRKNGIELEKDYPYKAQTQTCKYTASKKAASVTGYVNIAVGNETALVAAVASQGPISVAIDGSRRSLQLYSKGVYNDPSCSTQLNHAVTVVGYDTDPVGGDYYIVKNSWGTGWGEKGYVRMSRNRRNQCGIANKASFPLV